MSEDAEVPNEHQTSVRHQRAWDEYRPECSCGWVGSYWPAVMAAFASEEADDHVVEEGATR